MENVVICGDSFAIGIGCTDLINQPFGSLLAKKLGYNVVNLAKGSSTNLSIYLQVKYAIENVKDIKYLCVSTTSFNRIDWFTDNAKYTNYKLENQMVNYHQYPPFGKNTNFEREIENPMKNDSRYTGELLTENWIGVIEYVDKYLDKGVKPSLYFKRLQTESDSRMKLLRDFYFNFFDERIQREFDVGVIVMSHLLLKKHNIPHHILGWGEWYSDYIPNDNFVHIDWRELCTIYPDTVYNTMHTSDVGHTIVYDKIIDAINKNKRNNINTII